MTTHSCIALVNRWVRLVVGLALLVGILALLAMAPRPPGVAGEIIDRNIDQDIQATALIYMDLDRMPEIEERLDSSKELSCRDRAEVSTGR